METVAAAGPSLASRISTRMRFYNPDAARWVVAAIPTLGCWLSNGAPHRSATLSAARTLRARGDQHGSAVHPQGTKECQGNRPDIPGIALIGS